MEGCHYITNSKGQKSLLCSVARVVDKLDLDSVQNECEPYYSEVVTSFQSIALNGTANTKANWCDYHNVNHTQSAPIHGCREVIRLSFLRCSEVQDVFPGISPDLRRLIPDFLYRRSLDEVLAEGLVYKMRLLRINPALWRLISFLKRSL